MVPSTPGLLRQELNGAFGRERYIDRADHPGLRPAAESTEEVMTGF